MLDEFQKFITRGNIIDLAVGFTVGAAFTTIARSLVDDIIMPPVGLLLGRVNFNSLFIDLGPGHYESLAAAQEAGAATINYGRFINNIITFVIIAGVMFLVVRSVNRLRDLRERARNDPTIPPPEPATRKCPECLSVIPAGARRCAFCTVVVEATV